MPQPTNKLTKFWQEHGRRGDREKGRLGEWGDWERGRLCDWVTGRLGEEAT